MLGTRSMASGTFHSSRVLHSSQGTASGTASDVLTRSFMNLVSHQDGSSGRRMSRLRARAHLISILSIYLLSTEGRSGTSTVRRVTSVSSQIRNSATRAVKPSARPGSR